MVSNEQIQKYVEDGIRLTDPMHTWDWGSRADTFLREGGDPKLLDNVMEIMRALNSGTTQSAIRLFNSQEHINAALEAQFIGACHPNGQDFNFHIQHWGREIPGTYPARDANGNDLKHQMYDPQTTRWGTYDKMVEQFAKDKIRGIHSCAWFNNRLYYSSTMDFSDPYIAMTGRPSPTKEEREEAIQLRQEEGKLLYAESAKFVADTLPYVLSYEKYQEWHRYFANVKIDTLAISAQCHALGIIEMANRGQDIDDIKQHFDLNCPDEAKNMVAYFVERFSDDGQGMHKFLIADDRSELDISQDVGR